MKRLLFIISLILGTLSVCAQTMMDQKIDKTLNYTKKIFKNMEYGIKSVANYSGIIGLDKTSYYIGFNSGIYARYNLDSNIAIQPELVFSQQKFKRTSPKETITNNYLKLPIMLQCRLIDRLFFEVGPQLGFLVKETNYKLDKSTSIKANKFDLSLAVGARYDVGQYFEIPNLDLTVRYDFGLTNVYKHSKISKSRNAVLQSGLAYSF